MHKKITFFTFGYTAFMVAISLGKFVLGVMPKTIKHSDKIAHFVAYAVFAFVWALFFEKVKDLKKSKSLLITGVWSVFFGVAMEICQWFFTSYRQFEYYDIVANSIGIVIGLLIYSLFFAILEKRQA